jgi:transposase
MLNSRRYKKRAYVEQMLAKARQGNPAQSLVEIELTGEDGALCLTFRLDQSKLQAAKQLDGRYALATNATHLDANEALTLFKGQDGVEKTFRTIKGPLQVRPLFVQKDQRVEGLVFVTLLAMLVRALVVRQAREQGLAVTADQLWRGFAGLQAVDIRWQNGVCERQVVDLTAFQRDVLQALSWDAPVAYVRSP